MAPGRLAQQLGVGGQAAQIVPLLDGERLANEPLALDEHDAPQALPLLPALQPGEVRGRPAPPGLEPAVPLVPLPVVAHDLVPPEPPAVGLLPERHDLLMEVLVVALEGQDVVGPLLP